MKAPERLRTNDKNDKLKKNNLKKAVILFPILLLVFFCIYDNMHPTYFEKFKGEWEITNFLHKDKNLNSKGNFVIGFDRPFHFWITNFEEDSNKFIHSKYEVSKKGSNYTMDISCEDKMINGNYNVYFDTIKETDEQYIIRMTLDNESTYIQALRPKLKHAWPNK